MRATPFPTGAIGKTLENHYRDLRQVLKVTPLVVPEYSDGPTKSSKTHSQQKLPQTRFLESNWRPKLDAAQQPMPFGVRCHSDFLRRCRRSRANALGPVEHRSFREMVPSGHRHETHPRLSSWHVIESANGSDDLAETGRR